MRRLFLSTALALVPMPMLAEDAALILGTGRYETLGRLSRAEEVTTVAESLRALGFAVTALPNGRAVNTAVALGGFLEDAAGAERLLVVLSGRFATDGARTWFLTAEAAEPTLFGVEEVAISVDSLLQVLGRAQGRAVLVLGRDPGAQQAFDPWLREGVGALEVPQGVTVLTASHRDVAGFVGGELPLAGADLSRQVTDWGSIEVAGFLPPGFVFMPMQAAAPEPINPPVTPPDTAAEEALWQGAKALDTVEAYRNYLTRYPVGRHAAEAEEAIAAILAEPNREARLAEEALGLTRDQRREIQRDLSLLEFNTRGVDGIFGPGTRGAITNWQQDNGFAQTGYLTAEEINRLDAQAARRAAELQAEAERQRQEQARADRAFWEETGALGDGPGLRAYLDRYPDGLFSQMARDRLAAQEQEARAAAEAQDRADWDAARRADTVAAYQTYLTARPRGAFVEQARARIEELDRGEVLNEEIDSARAVEAGLGLNALSARVVEERLADMGLDPGVVDGSIDEDTRRALRNYQRQASLPVSGYLDEQTLVRLLADTINDAMGQ